MKEEERENGERQWRPGEPAGEDDSLERGGMTPGATGTTLDATVDRNDVGGEADAPEREQPDWRPSGSIADEDAAPGD